MSNLKQCLDKIYDVNPYVQLLGMVIEDVKEGMVELSMQIDTKHTNIHKVTHGGALASLADTAMGIVCLTEGKKAVTMEMNINFIHSALVATKITALGRVVHKGKTTLVTECDIYDDTDKLLAIARGTFFVVSDFERS